MDRLDFDRRPARNYQQLGLAVEMAGIVQL